MVKSTKNRTNIRINNTRKINEEKIGIKVKIENQASSCCWKQ